MKAVLETIQKTGIVAIVRLERYDQQKRLRKRSVPGESRD